MNPSATAIEVLTDSGLPGVGEVRWGSHICHFYRAREDLLEALVPFFVAGIRNGERCLWITCEPLPAAEAIAALGSEVADLGERTARGQVEIRDHDRWYGDGQSFDAAATLRAWLSCEEEALRQGFTGLRVNGNAPYLANSDWAAFTDYERRVHGAFRNRRILGLCSYGLERFSPDRLVGVLDSHGFALVRREDGWEVVQSSGLLLDSLGLCADRSCDHGEHLVQFHAERFLPGPVAEFLGPGLRDPRGAALALARPEHLAALERELAERGIDVARAGLDGRLALVDAVEVLRELRAGPAGEAGFRALVADRVAGLAARHPGLRVYGELVDLLCEAGDLEGALELERWWNAALERSPFALLCGYGTSHLDCSDPTAARRVCSEHHEVLSASGGDSQSALVEGERQARARVQSAARHLAQLQRITSSLSEAAAPDDIARVVTGEIPAVVGAELGLLALPDGSDLRVMGLRARRDLAIRLLGRVARDADDPLAACLRSGEALWTTRAAADGERSPAWREGLRSVAYLPLALGAQRLGVAAYGYLAPRRFDPADRARLKDLTRQAALALERSRLYETAERERERAEAANHAKDEFLATVSHELRTPLNAIVMWAQFLQGVDDPKIVREGIDTILRSGRLQSQLIEDILDMSRVATGRLRLEVAPVDLEGVVAEACDAVRFAADAKRIRLRTRVRRRARLISGDAARLQQIVWNLLSNAIKFSERGGDVELVAERAGSVVRLSVRDLGEGIPADELPFVFERFHQVDRSKTRRRGGLGLGLAIVRNLVELHGGNVRASSEGAGRGATFTVELPVAVTRDRGARAVPQRSADVASGRDTLAGAAVLLVEDHADSRAILARLLRSTGAEVEAVDSADAALRALEDRSFDVLLSDVEMPERSGYDLVRVLRAHPDPRLRDLPAVAVTAHASARERLRALEAGFQSHVAKPLDPEKLNLVLRRLVRRRARDPR